MAAGPSRENPPQGKRLVNGVLVYAGRVWSQYVTVPVVASAPGIFTAGEGVGQAAALNADNSYNSATNPATRGSVVVLYPEPWLVNRS